MKLLLVVVFVFLVVNLVKAEEFVFKFGIDAGRVIHTGEGNIPLLQYNSEVIIPVPEGVTITYVEVTVDALSPPKVQYDSLYHKVIINYTWTQIALSSYKIVVKGY